MKKGPPIEELTRHLAECPESFLAEPLQPNGTGTVHVAAVVSDLISMMGGEPLTSRQVKLFSYRSKKNLATDRKRLRMALVGCWLLYNSSVRELTEPQDALRFLEEELPELASLLPSEQVVTDPERREEFSRLLLRTLDILPDGEGEKEAENRFEALSTIKRDAVVRAAQEAEKRARKLREELARKERERRAASVYSHE